MAQLVVESGEETGHRYTVGPLCILGRLKSCDVPVKDNKASRNNTKIRLQDGAWTVEDLQSSNGTYLNEERITSAPLNDGDRIRIGKTVFRFETAAAPAPKPAAAPAPKPAPPRPPAPKPPPAPNPQDLSARELASFETPPGGVAGFADGDDVEELDLGGGDDDSPALPAAPRPASAPAPSTPKPRPAYVARIPLEPTGPRSRRRSLLLEDVSQRSALFRVFLYLAILAGMVLLAYVSFTLIRA